MKGELPQVSDPFLKDLPQIMALVPYFRMLNIPSNGDESRIAATFSRNDVVAFFKLRVVVYPYSTHMPHPGSLALTHFLLP